jgi:hypothetical protein
MDSALISMVEMVGVGRYEISAEKVLMLDHQRVGYHSFNVLNRLYPNFFEKADKLKFVYDACEFGKLTRSLYMKQSPQLGLIDSRRL